MLLESKWPEGGPRREPPFREKQGREAAGDPAPTDLLRGLGQFPLTSLNSFSQHKIQGDEAQFKGLLPGESAVREATQNTFRMKAQATRAAMTTAVITMATGNALGERQTSLSNKPRAGRQGGVLFPPTFSLVARLWPRGRAPEGRNGGRVTGRQPFLTWSCPDPPASAQLTQAKASPFLTQALLPSELLSCCSPPPPPPPCEHPRHSAPAPSCLWRCSRHLSPDPSPTPLPFPTPGLQQRGSIISLLCSLTAQSSAYHIVGALNILGGETPLQTRRPESGRAREVQTGARPGGNLSYIAHRPTTPQPPIYASSRFQCSRTEKGKFNTAERT